MGLVIVPIKEDKVEAWKNWNGTLAAEKKGDFDDLNKRYDLIRNFNYPRR